MIVESKFELLFCGSCEGMVYYYNKRLGKMIARKWVKPKTTAANKRLGAISRNLKKLNPSDGFIKDLRVYIALYYYSPGEKHYMSWQNVYLTLMYKLAKHNPAVDLLTLSREQITSDNLPCKCVKDAIEAGLLREVNGYEKLTQEI